MFGWFMLNTRLDEKMAEKRAKKKRQLQKQHQHQQQLTTLQKHQNQNLNHHQPQHTTTSTVPNSWIVICEKCDHPQTQCQCFSDNNI